MFQQNYHCQCKCESTVSWQNRPGLRCSCEASWWQMHLCYTIYHQISHQSRRGVAQVPANCIQVLELQENRPTSKSLMTLRYLNGMAVIQGIKLKCLRVGRCDKLSPDVKLRKQVINTKVLYEGCKPLIQPQVSPPFLKKFHGSKIKCLHTAIAGSISMYKQEAHNHFESCP